MFRSYAWPCGSAARWSFFTIVTPEIFGQLVDRSQAGRIAAAILEKFHASVLVAVVILGVTIWIQLIALGPSIAIRLRVALMLVSLAILIETYVRFIVLNRMRKILKESAETGTRGGKDEFRRLHNRSTRSFLLNLFLGIAVVITLVMPSS
ncbi:MAG: DUF4149 domain-containing protein [Bacteroidota bacterium]